MDVAEAFMDTIKNDKGRIFNEFVREDIKSPFIDAKRWAVSLVKRGGDRGGKMWQNVQDAIEQIKKDGTKKTYDNAKDSVSAATQSVLEQVQSAAAKVKEDGIEKTYDNAKEEVVASAKQLNPKRYKQAFSALFDQVSKELAAKKSNKAKTIYVLEMLSYFTSFTIGIYLGQAIPDKDIAMFGIGKHRNIVTHSILPAMFFALLAKLMFRVVDTVYSKVGTHPDSGKRELAVIRRHLLAISGGLSVGVAAHLLQDGLLEPSGTIRGPGFNTFISGTTLDDQAFLVVNAFFSLLLGKKSVADISRKTA